MLNYKDTLELVALTLEAHGYPVHREIGGGGIELLEAKLSPTPKGRNRIILFGGYAYTGLEVQVEYEDGIFEREPWCPMIEFPQIEDEETGEFFSYAVVRSTQDFLAEVRAL